jgi:MFS family permease
VAASTQELSARPDGSTYAYVVLLILGALDAAGYSIIAPVAPEISRATGAGPSIMGALVASFPLGIVGGFALAAVGIKRGRTRQVLLVSLVILAAGSLGFVIGEGLEVYFAARLIMGLGSGGVWMGVTFNTLDRWPGQEYLCMSRIFAAYSVGGLLGPALGTLGGIARPFAAYSVLVSVTIVLVSAMGEGRDVRSFDTDRTALRMPTFWVASAGILFAVLGLGMVEGVLPLHLAAGLSQKGIGAIYATMSVVVAASAAYAARFRPRNVLVAALGLIVSGIAVAGMAHQVPVWAGALAAAGVGIGLANTGSIGVLLEGVPTERIVTAMVVWSQLGIVGYFVGPLAGGVVAQAAGYGAIGLIPLLAAIPVMLLAIRTRDR